MSAGAIPPGTPTDGMIAEAEVCSKLSEEIADAARQAFDGVLILALKLSDDGGVSMHIKTRLGGDLREGSDEERILWQFLDRCSSSIRKHSAELFGGVQTVVRDVTREPVGMAAPKVKA